MNRPARQLCRALSFSVFWSLGSIALAVPTANNDTYSTNEDRALVVTNAPLLDADFDSGGSSSITFNGNWTYLDQIQNGNGSNHTYPVDGSSNAWNSVNFNPATSTVGTWLNAPMPLQAGGLTALPDAPDILAGIGSATNGQNLITTYLFRNTFTLSAAQAAISSWTTNILCDDGCVIYINGTEVDRFNIAAGAVTTNTFAANGDETTYSSRPLSIAGVLVTGLNTIAIEVHQTANTSSDAGIDLTLNAGDTQTSGFTYQDDFFGTGFPNNATGQLDASGGFNGTAGLNVQVGFGLRFFSEGAKSGAWRRNINLTSPGSVTFSLRYRLVTSNGFDQGDFAEAILDIDGTRYGTGQNNSLARIEAVGDTGWQTASFNVPLSSGSHTVALGIYNNLSRGNNEFADVWFDDVLAQFQGGAGGVLSNDAGNNPTATLVSTTTHGTLNLASDGTFTYTPNLNYFGTDSFTYRAVDNTGNSNIATATITINAVNDTPIALPNSYSATEDTTLNVPVATGVLVNDSDVENQTLSAVLVSQALNGTVSLNSNGSFSYTPNANFFGNDSFTYSASDGNSASPPATVSLTVASQNDPPVAVADTYTAMENTQLVISNTGSGTVVFTTTFDSGLPAQISGPAVIESVQGFNGFGQNNNFFNGNFYRHSGGVQGNGEQTPVTLTLTSLPAHTSLSIEFLLAIIDSWDGYSGGIVDSFAVRVDGQTVFFNTFTDDLTSQTYAPLPGGELSSLTNLGFSANTDLAYDMTLESALRDIPHTASTATIVLVAGGNGWDGGAGESWAIDNLTVRLGNTPRQAILPTGSTWKYLDNGSDQGTAWQSPSFNDSTWASGPSKLGYGDGDEATTVSFGPDSAAKYPTTYFRTQFNIPNAAAFDRLIFTILHDDSAAAYLNGIEIQRTNLGASADSGDYANVSFPNAIENAFFTHSALGSLLVDGTNTLAVEVHQADAGSSDMNFNFSLTGLAPAGQGGVLSNDYDVDAQALTATLISTTPNGTLNFNPNGTFTYTPGINFHGTDTFTYAASDGTLSTNATVTIIVEPGPNDLPETVADAYNGTEDQTLTVPVANGVLNNDSDADLDPLTAILNSPPSSGTLNLNPNGSFTYTPNPNFAGVDTFTYFANDTIGNSASTLVTLTISNVPDRPVAVADTFVAQPGQLLTVPAAAGVLANDTDADAGTTLTAQLVSNVSSGTLNLAANGGFTYQPAGGFVGSVTFTYRNTDGALQSLINATVTIHVNSRPIAGTNSYTVAEDQTLNVPATGVLGNDSDPENQPLTAILITPPVHGTLNLSSNGAFTYQPAPNYFGPDSFVYAANDGRQNSANTSVTLTVTSVNDPPVAMEDAYSLNAGETLTINSAQGVLANDSDPDNPILTASLLSTTTNGTLSLAANGSFTYTPNPGFNGNDTFSYTATDGALTSSAVIVTLTVAPATESIVINEIMYHPTSENSAEEFIEIFNKGDAAVDLSGWQFISGISFTFPSVSIPAGGYLVIAADPTTFTATYGATSLIVGPWTGGLSNRGERIRLTDNLGNQSDDITYSDQGDWAQRVSVTDGGEQGWIWVANHDGGGSSLELINPNISNKNGQNWAPSPAPTPGAVNSNIVADTAPLISDVKHRPAVPKSTESVTITAKLKDTADVTLTATLYSRVSTASPGAFTSRPMFDDGLHGDGAASDGEFGVILQPSANSTIIEFYVRASDGTNLRTWPAPTNTGQNANALFQFDNESFTAHIPIYRTIISQADEDRFPFTNRASNAEMNTTFIADNCGDISVRYLCGMRIRGASSRNDTPPPTRLNIPADNNWNGETRLNLNTQYAWLQFIGMQFFQKSGIAAPDTIRVAMRRNGVDQTEQGVEGYGSLVHVQPLQEEFLDTHIPIDAGGNLYKKVRPDVDWAYRNGVLTAYAADGWGKQTNSSEDDWSDLDEWLRVMNQATGAGNYIAQVEAVANLDQWLKWFAINTIIANGETNASNGADDDYSVYSGINDTRFIFVPHDLDTILGQGDSSTITDPQSTIFDMIERGDTLAPLIPLFQNAGILTRYYQALREQLQTTFSQEQFDALLDNQLNGWVPQATIANMKTYMNTRRTHIEGLVNAQLGAPPALTPATTIGTLVSAHGSVYISEVFANNASTYNIGGIFPDMIELRNDGGSAVDISGMSITDTATLPTRYIFPANTFVPANGFLVLTSTQLGFGLDAQGDSVLVYNGIGTLLDSIDFGLQIPDMSIGRTGAARDTWTLTTPSMNAANVAQPLGNPDTLMINEWLVRPQVTFDRDFVELYNPSPLPVALGGLVITDEPVAIPQRHTVRQLSFIAGSGFALLYPVGSGSYTESNGSELPYKLSADFGWLSISGTNGIEMDEIHYICQRNDVAFGRETDGAAAIVDFDLPTPGFSNQTSLTNEANILQSLRITEIMYHPSLGGDLEYLRLKNIGTSTINLGGIRMSNGITIDLPANDLAPGEETVIVRDQLLYESIYGTTGILGQYSGSLSNGGERLRLEITSLGYGILDFDFLDTWYPTTDGLGASLLIVNENSARNTWNDKESWMASGPDDSTYGGWASSRFTTDNLTIIGKLADPDNDGISNAIEYGLGLNPNITDPSGLPTGIIENGFLTMTYKRNKAANVQWIVEVSSDMETWDSGPTHLTESKQSDNGIIETWKATDSVPINTADERFMRVKVIVP
jgi:VCBS repeat-containing protein